jgi:hypothetical protein
MALSRLKIYWHMCAPLLPTSVDPYETEKKAAHLESLGIAGGEHPLGVIQLPPQLPNVFLGPTAIHHHHLHQQPVCLMPFLGAI